MGNTEQNAKWLSEQRARMVKAVNEVVAIVVNQNLNVNEDPKYQIEFSVSMLGNYTELRVYEKSGKLIEVVDYWLMRTVLRERPFCFNKGEIEAEVNNFLSEVKKMKECAMKYAKLNEQ